jgi:hypothetical protein
MNISTLPRGFSVPPKGGNQYQVRIDFTLVDNTVVQVWERASANFALHLYGAKLAWVGDGGTVVKAMVGNVPVRDAGKDPQPEVIRIPAPTEPPKRKSSASHKKAASPPPLPERALRK